MELPTYPHILTNEPATLLAFLSFDEAQELPPCEEDAHCGYPVEAEDHD